MPEVTDPNLLAQLNMGQPQPRPMGVQPQPFPGPRGMVTGPTVQSPRMRSLDQADTRIGFDAESNRRAWEAQEMERERLRLAQDRAAADRKAREANAGVDTTASQDQAAGHAIMLRDSLRVLNDVRKNAPEQIQPSWKEFGVSFLTSDDPTLTGLVQPEQRQRAANAYRGAVESAIWLMTGAAAPADQVQRIYSNVAPTAADKPGVLEDKRQRLLAFIGQAQARAGAAQLKIDGTPYTEEDVKALEEFKNNINLIYGDEKAGEAAKPTLSDEKVTIPVPSEMQAEHMAFFNDPANARGKLSLGTYLDFRKKLQEKYDYGEGQMDFPGLETFIKAYNEGKKVDFNLAPEERELNIAGRLIADASDSDIGAGLKSYASAMTLGAPELLAGEGGRVASALVDEAHPKSALAGEVLGSIAPGIAIEKGLAKGATKFLGKNAADRTARIGADVIGNAALGGVTELNQTGDTDKALEASAYGAGGAAVARPIAKGFAELKPKEFREGLEALGPQDILDDAGKKVGTIPGTDLTTAQRMGAERAEEFFEGIPTVAPARQKAVNDWNRHNSARVLARVGLKLPKNIQPGQHANAYVHKALGEEYNKIAPQIKGTVDKDWQTALAAIRNDALKPPGKGKKVPDDVKEMWQHLEDAAANLNVNGKFDYASYKKFSQQVREWQRFWASSKIGTDEIPSPIMNQMARRAEDLLTQARALVSRANPAAGARLKKIDTAWRHQMINDIASLGAAKQNRGVASPQEWLNAVERLDFSKGRTATAQGKAFEQKYGQHAMDVLGKKPSRGASLLGTGALGYTVGGAVMSPVLAANYAPGVKRLTQALTDGQLGKRLDNLTPEQIKAKFPWAKELPTDVIKQTMATYIREKAIRK